MEQPPGLVNPTFPNHVCLLNKSIYGLKQAPRAWFECLSHSLFAIGFSCSKADPSLFIHKDKHDIILLLIYVADVIITGSNSTLIQKLIHKLGCEFALKDLGLLHYFLGIEVKPFTGGIFLSQTKYTKELLTRTHMLESSHLSTPIAIKPPNQPDDPTLVDETEFRSLVGALQYLTFTRPYHSCSK